MRRAPVQLAFIVVGCDHLYDRRDCFGDLGAASTASGALGSNRYNTRSLLCVGPSGILPPRGPFYKHRISWASLELESLRWAVLLWSW